MKAQNGLVTFENKGESVRVRVALDTEKVWFDGLLAAKHYLGAGQPVGDYLRQVVDVDGKPVALLVWGPQPVTPLRIETTGLAGAKFIVWSGSS